MTGGHTPSITRRSVVCGTAAATLVAQETKAQERRNPIIGHAIATLGVPDVAAAQAMYEKAIGLYEVNRGTVSEQVASSWGAPAMQGRPWVMMRCESGDPTFRIRIVQVDPVPGYRAMTTWGLNAFEMISQDIYTVNERVLSAGFEVIGKPAPLSGAYASIHAMQMKGPGEEAFFFISYAPGNNEFGLVEPASLVDRIINTVIGTPNIKASRNFYSAILGMSLRNLVEAEIEFFADMLGFSRDRTIALGSARGRRNGSSLEFVAFPVEHSGPRSRAKGQLPPGVSMISLATDDFDSLDVSYIAPPKVLYGGGRVATFVGPAGEWVEVIEQEAT